jgi:chromosome segregation ATPase
VADITAVLTGALDSAYQQLREALVQQSQECEALRARAAELGAQVMTLKSQRGMQLESLEYWKSRSASLQEEKGLLETENKRLRDVLATIRCTLPEL